MGFIVSMSRSVLTLDRSRLRGWSAARRSVIVLAAAIIGGLLTEPKVGALAGVAALYVGLQDRAADPVRYTLLVMTLESFLLAGVLLVAGVLPNRESVAVLLVACAVTAGLFAQHDKAISRMFADVLVVLAFLGLTEISVTDALTYSVVVLAAGLAQTLGTLAAVRIFADLPERRPIAAGMLAVADHLDDCSRREVRGTGEASEEALNRAEQMLARTDLSHSRRRALRRLITDSEALRDEGSAIRTTLAFEISQGVSTEVEQALNLAALTLRTAARELNSTLAGQLLPHTRSVASLSQLKQQAAAIASDPSLDPTARALAARTARLARHTEAVLADDGTTRKGNPLTAMPLDVELGKTDIRVGVRLGVAAASALIVAALMNLPYGGWVAATAVALLRPDHRALTSDTIARAVGTGIGALAVIPLVAVGSLAGWLDLVFLGALAFMAFVVTAANEGLFVIAITVFTVFSRAVVGEDPLTVATSRMFDVLVGCAIAVLLLLLIPLKDARMLRHDLAAYARTTAEWLDGVALRCEGNSMSHPKRRRRAMRQSRADVQHRLELRQLEPIGPGLPLWYGHSLFHGIHDCERAGTAAVTLLDQSVPPGEHAAQLARHAADDLLAISHKLEHPSAFEADDGADLYGVDFPVRGDIDELLNMAAQEASTTRATAMAGPRSRN